ncbi:dethiobiotin synthase [Thermaerobacillus caldiproteolyticus]|uniref:ATP-dependent dethiobiotin synthetase BioD n=1 Tax=Thermaerobacillus caldiproteolyticus TaxID=247480 RepID=A0A7W0C0I3_9BACL|nr:dethiobiotin synthase [Anoxybacillus caldiproteolyticus]MBA2875681.1 dethiobiotin synthetase [Anoxybacillus caldiproteolyticus]
MRKAIFITGTGTEIGKTMVTSFLALALQEMGLKTKIFKPIQTGLAEESSSFADQYWYETVMGAEKGSTGMYYMEPAVSPHLASAITNTPIAPHLIKNKIVELKNQYDVVLVEGAGGLAVPLIETGHDFYMTKDLIQECELPTVIVSLAGLGAIHHVVTTVSYAEKHGVDVLGFVFNQFDASNVIHVDNVRTIQKLLGLPIIAKVPVFKHLSRNNLAAFVQAFLENHEQKSLFMEGLSIEV